jgi:hypothetical protein
MPLPILLIHGYSAEGDPLDDDPHSPDGDKAYGALAKELRSLGRETAVVNLSRWISLDDGLGIDDVSLAMDRAIRAQPEEFLRQGFVAIVHSAGSLVARNWVRRHAAPGCCPLKGIIHLAGACFGSGWAHMGATDIAKFLRGMAGQERGLGVLRALELGSPWTLDLHSHFLRRGFSMAEDYGVAEFGIIGSCPHFSSAMIPVRYGREDGSDGVVRVSASSLNWNLLSWVPTQECQSLDWSEALDLSHGALGRTRGEGLADGGPRLYRLESVSFPGQADQGWPESQGSPRLTPRPLQPFAVLGQTDHGSSREWGILGARRLRSEVMPLLKEALAACDESGGAAAMARCHPLFEEASRDAFRRAVSSQTRIPLLFRPRRGAKRAQYDAHAQVIFRVRDQFGLPVRDFTAFFFHDVDAGAQGRRRVISSLVEDHHQTGGGQGTSVYYLRVGEGRGTCRLSELAPLSLEVSAIVPGTRRAVYIPFLLRLTETEMRDWVRPHQTTVMDIMLFRMPAPAVFQSRPWPAPSVQRQRSHIDILST